MSLLSTLNRVSEFQPEPFVTPMWNPHMRVLSVQDNIPIWCDVNVHIPGWWKVTPDSKLGLYYTATTLSPAAPWEQYTFLEQLPRFYIITLFRVRENTWLCVPYNAADAAQRYWPNSTPREVHLVNENISQLTCISARLFADIMLYESVARIIAETSPSIGLARGIIREREVELEKRQRELERLERDAVLRNSLEGRIEQHLDFMGASVVQWEEEGEGVRVTWEYEGYRHTSRIARDTSVLSAGICLSGTDREHNLSTLVATIQEARELHRFDMPRESYV